MLLRARIESEGAEVRGFVRNLSQTGAMMDAHHGLHADQVVTLICGEAEIRARVAWIEERRLGLQFSVPLSDATVAELAAPRKALAS